MADRTAIDTIRGYFYQFDYTIASLLNLKNEDETTTIEGVEDIDINTATETTAVQCKYYSKTEYNHSIIAEPIRLMLDHFKEVKSGAKKKVKYKLKGHYKSGQNKLILPLDVQSLKDNFLTYSRAKVKYYHHDELGLNDTDLANFISTLDIDINAPEFEKQYHDILIELRSRFNCSFFTAEYLFYNCALGLVKKLSIEALNQSRTISKRDFLSGIKIDKVLFDEWFVKFKGEKMHFENLRNEYFGGLNMLSRERFFLIEIDQNTYSRTEVKEILIFIIKKYSKILNQPKPFSPCVYLHGISNDELREIKKDLIANDIFISDGFDYEGAAFDPVSILKAPNLGNQIKIRFLNNISHLDITLQRSGRRSEIFQFYISDTFFNFNNSSVKEVKIQINQLKNIKNII